MNVIPTLEGGLRIDADSEMDWHVLESIHPDANLGATDLASRLGLPMESDPHADDWKEFVVPELQDGFRDQLHRVALMIGDARKEAKEGKASIWITREDGMVWYGALNQARLAIEDRFRFGPSDEWNIEIEQDPLRKAAFMRARFYQIVQGMLLDYVIS